MLPGKRQQLRMRLPAKVVGEDEKICGINSTPAVQVEQRVRTAKRIDEQEEVTESDDAVGVEIGCRCVGIRLNHSVSEVLSVVGRIGFDLVGGEGEFEIQITALQGSKVKEDVE